MMLAERLPELSLVAGSRPPEEGCEHGGDRVRPSGALQTLGLGALNQAQTPRVIGHLCGVASVPDELSQLIQRRSDGNPFYIQQLTLELRESGHVEIVGGRCKLREDIAERVANALPDKLRGVITSRVDRLGDDAAAGAEGGLRLRPCFREAALERDAPDRAAARAHRRGAGVLLGSNLIHRETADGEPSYAFTHALVQEAIYELLPMAQRKRLHRRIADWLEAQHAGAMAGFYGVLASHCMLADEFARALNHLEGGALTAMRHSAYREAITHLANGAAHRARSARSTPIALRQARWQSLLGDSHHELSEFVQAEKQYLKVLALLGQPYAPSAARPGGRHPGAAVAAGGLPHARTAQRAPTPRVAEALRLASHAYSQLSEIYYHENNPLAVLQLTLLSVQHAQRAGVDAELRKATARWRSASARPDWRASRAATAQRRSSWPSRGRRCQRHGLCTSAGHRACVEPMRLGTLLDSSGSRAADAVSRNSASLSARRSAGLRAVGALQRGRIRRSRALVERDERSGARHAAARARLALCRGLQLRHRFGRVDAAEVEAVQRAPRERRIAGRPPDVAGLGGLGLAAAGRSGARAGRRPRRASSCCSGRRRWPAPVSSTGRWAWSRRCSPAADGAGADRPGARRRTARACAMLNIYTQQVPSTRPRGYFLLACQAEIKGSQAAGDGAVAQGRRQRARRCRCPTTRRAALLALGQRLPAGNAELAQAQRSFDALRRAQPRLFQPAGTGIEGARSGGTQEDRDPRWRHGRADGRVPPDAQRGAAREARGDGLPDRLAAGRQGRDRAARRPHRGTWPAYLVRLLRQRLSHAARGLSRLAARSRRTRCRAGATRCSRNRSRRSGRTSSR